MPATQPEEAVFTRLSGYAPLLSLVPAARITPRYTPQDPPALPVIVYRRQGAEPTPNLAAGTSKAVKYLVRVEVHARAEADTLAPLKACYDAVNGWSDQSNGVLGAFHVDDDAGEDDDGTKFTARVFAVWFQPVGG